MNNKILSTWYKGKCHAPGIRVEEEAEQVKESSQDIQISAEESELDVAYEELEVIKRRLLLMRGKLLVVRVDPCEEGKISSPQEDSHFLTPNQKLLMQLRRNNCLLKCRLQKLMQHLQHTRSHIKKLEAMRCQLNSRLTKMTNTLNQLEEFKLTTMEKAGICIEREQQISVCKVDDSDLTRKLQVLMEHQGARMRCLVPLRCHDQLHYNISVELVLMRIVLQTLLKQMQDNWEKRTQQRNLRSSAIVQTISFRQ